MNNSLNGHNLFPDPETVQDKLRYAREKMKAKTAFDHAIETGRLSADKTADNFAGNYMYMGQNSAGKDLFKNIITREYID